MKHTKRDKNKFLKLLENNSGNVFRACDQYGISRATFYNWKKEEWFMEKLEEQRERELKAAYQAHRRLREGKAQEDDEGNFVRWIERPDRQALEKYLGIHDDNFKPAVEMASDIPEQVIIIAGKEIILNPQRQQEPIDITAQQNTEQPQIAPPVENKDNQ